MNEEYQIENIRVSPQRNLLIKGDERLSLEPRVMEVLSFLASQPRTVVLREEIISTLWSVQYGGDESLTRAISLLRKSFKTLGVDKQIIETIPKRGYRLATTIGHRDNIEPLSDKLGSEGPVMTHRPVIQEELDAQSDLSENMPTAPAIQFAAASQKKSLNPLFPIMAMAIFCLGILAFALRPSSDFAPTATAPAETVQTLNSTPQNDYEYKASQGDVATAIIMTYLDGHIDRETAIATASTHLKIAQAESPNSADTLTAEGWMYYVQQRPDDAMLRFEIVTSRDLIVSDAWLGKAFIYKEQGKPDLAIHNFDQAIANDELSMTALNAKARYLLNLGRFSEALTVANEILFFDSDDQNTLNLIANIKRQMK